MSDHWNSTTLCTAFCGRKRIASGALLDVALKAKAVLEPDDDAQVLIFDDITSELIEVDFRGTRAQVAKRLEKMAGDGEAAEPSRLNSEAKGPGRPKLGVVGREVTLLPRHWDWLATQPGGASVALRKLVEHARKVSRDRDQIRRAQEATYRFMSAIAGNEPGFEEAIRALFGADPKRFAAMIEAWPHDVRQHAKKLAAAAFAASNAPAQEESE
jgi:uncharacterized protein